MNSAILLAGGMSRRMKNATVDKVLEPLYGGQPSIALCIRAFAQSGAVGRIIIATRDASQMRAIEQYAKPFSKELEFHYVPGGAERADSVLNALKAIPEKDKGNLAFVHDSARPLVESNAIAELNRLAIENGAACLAHPVSDTIKQVQDGDAKRGKDTLSTPAPLSDLPRHTLFAMETPQVFNAALLEKAYTKASLEGLTVTDDAAAAALLNKHPALFMPGTPNPKLTNANDFDLVNLLLMKRQEKGTPASQPAPKNCPFRIGHGYDIHRFKEGRKLVLGGVEIAHPRGLDGHSDADCLSHAIADAILGAAALPDIGHFFPPGKKETKDMDSLKIISGAAHEAAKLGLYPVNVDATLIAEEPKIAPHVKAMKERIGNALGLPPQMVGLKATTNEKMGSMGRAEGISAHAVVLMEAR